MRPIATGVLMLLSASLVAADADDPIVVTAAKLRKVGGITWTPEEIAFAKTLQTSLVNPPSIDTVKTVEPYKIELEGGGGSTDVSDISWVTPTVGLGTATFVPGSAGHSWQNVAAAGMAVPVAIAVSQGRSSYR